MLLGPSDSAALKVVTISLLREWWLSLAQSCRRGTTMATGCNTYSRGRWVWFINLPEAGPLKNTASLLPAPQGVMLSTPHGIHPFLRGTSQPYLNQEPPSRQTVAFSQWMYFLATQYALTTTSTNFSPSALIRHWKQNHSQLICTHAEFKCEGCYMTYRLAFLTVWFVSERGKGGPKKRGKKSLVIICRETELGAGWNPVL